MKDLFSRIFRDKNRILFGYQRRTFTVRDAVATIEKFKKQIPDKFTFIGISVHSPFLLLCSLFSSWQKSKVPILLDPFLKEELSSVIRDFGDLPIFTEDHENISSEYELLNAVNGSDKVEFIPTIPDLNEDMVGFLTSGSEGSPKIILKKSRQVLNELSVLQSTLNVKEHWSILSLVPPYHIYGFLFSVMLPVLGKARAIFTTGRIYPDLKVELSQCEPDVIVGSPVHYQSFLHSFKSMPRKCPELFLSSGAPLHDKIIKDFYELTGNHILQIYGSTETGGVATRCETHLWKPLPGVEIRQSGNKGILEVQSSWASYENQHSWQRTNDVCKIEKHGFQLLGRADSILKFHGKRFSASEVEGAILKYKNITEAVVLMVYCDEKEYFAAFYTSSDKSLIERNLLNKYLQDCLASYKIPRIIRYIPEIPKLKMGKVDYGKLKGMVEKIVRKKSV